MNLASVFRENSSPLEPLPTDIMPELPIIPGIRGVVFDIYGTLFISGSGDISLANNNYKESQMLEAFEACGIELPPDHPPIAPLFHDAIFRSHAERHAEGNAFPEVEIRDIWKELLRRLSFNFDSNHIERLAVEYECRANPVWPMPGLYKTLASLRGAGMQLGIISNAQFFTPLMFEAFMGERLESFGFDADLSIWSFQERYGKPSVELYAKLAETLLQRGIHAPEVLYVGNDIRNDIWPARSVGFLTALFAGDLRSLRVRARDPICFDVSADAIVTDLRQILQIVGVEKP
jgi:putative hydrolase of the HAD superfamily